MHKVVALVTLADGSGSADRDAVRDTMVSLSRAAGGVVADVVHGAAGGDLAWHWRLGDDADPRAAEAPVSSIARDPRVAGIEAVAYRPRTVRVAAADIADAIHRTLLVNVEDTASAEARAAFVADLAQMPGHIDEIRNAAVGEAVWSFGRRRWTHIWEQEFGALDDLNGAYMRHPYHWAHVDRWFDAEAPERIVADDLCHSAAAIPRSIIAGYG